MTGSTEGLNRWLTLGANVGVVLGLIVLIIEVRQNAALTRLSQETERATMLMQMELGLATSAASDAWIKAIHSPEDLTDGELRMAETQLVAIMQQWDTLLLMEQEGLVGRARIKMHIQNTAPVYFGSRFAKRWWEREEIGWSGTPMFEVADPIVAAVDPDFLVETYAFLRAPFAAAAGGAVQFQTVNGDAPQATAPSADLETQAQSFMAAYADDLRNGDRDGVAERYHAEGAYAIFNGSGGFRSFGAIAARYRETWAPPLSFEWLNLVYEPLGPDAVAVVGGFAWSDGSGVGRYSYTGILRREDGALKIVLEDKTRIIEAPDTAEDEIHAAIIEWVDIYNRNDWAALAAQFTEEAVMMPPNSPAVTGRAAIAAWEAANEAGFQIALKPDDISITGDSAIVRGRSCVFIPSDEDGTGVDIGKFLEVRRRQPDGRWLVSHDAFNSDLPPGAALAAACPADITGGAERGAFK